MRLPASVPPVVIATDGAPITIPPPGIAIEPQVEAPMVVGSTPVAPMFNGDVASPGVVVEGYPSASCSTGSCATGSCGSAGCSTCGRRSTGGPFRRWFGGQDECSMGCPSECGTAPCNFPIAYARLESLFLKRSQESDLIYLTGVAGGTPFTRSLSNFDFDYEPGVRFTYGQKMGANTYGEFTYFGLHEWNVRSSFGNNNVVTLDNGILPAFADPIFAQTMNYETRLHNAEFNSRTFVWVYPHVSVLAGFRFISLQDQLTIREQGIVADRLGSGIFSSRTRNRMFGVQVGLDWTQAVNCNVEVGSFTKIGLLSNSANMRMFANYGNSVDVSDAIQSGEEGIDLSILVEMGFAVTYRINQNLHLRTGYQFLFLSNAALAPNQSFPATGANDYLNDDDDILFHGPFVGFEYRWGDPCSSCGGGCP
jgi:hypothetical protein